MGRGTTSFSRWVKHVRCEQLFSGAPASLAGCRSHTCLEALSQFLRNPRP